MLVKFYLLVLYIFQSQCLSRIFFPTEFCLIVFYSDGLQLENYVSDGIMVRIHMVTIQSFIRVVYTGVG